MIQFHLARTPVNTDLKYEAIEVATQELFLPARSEYVHTLEFSRSDALVP